MQLLKLLALVCSLSFAQLTGTQPTDQTDKSITHQGPETTTHKFHPTQDPYYINQQLGILQLQKGRPTITAIPSYLNGTKCINTTGSCITFNDGTTQNTAASSPVSGVSSNTFVMLSYSSGTIQPFTVGPFVATTTYKWIYDISITSGTNATNATVVCTVNGDSTAADYNEGANGYPNGYVINNSLASFGFNACGGGAVQTGDFVHGVINLTSPSGLSNLLSFTGTWSSSCQAKTIHQSEFVSGFYSGSPPWTFTCKPITTQGWSWESQVLVSSPTPTITGPTGAQGPSGTFGGSGSITTNVVSKFASATTLKNSAITDNGTTVSMTEPLSIVSGADTNMSLIRATDFINYNIMSVNNGTTLAAGAGIYGGATFDNQLYVVSPATITFVTNNISQGIIFANGNVGVGGYLTPAFKLDTNSYERKETACTSVTTCTATCSAGKQVVGGGCRGATGILSDSASGSATTWVCTIGLGNVTAQAICLNMN